MTESVSAAATARGRTRGRTRWAASAAAVWSVAFAAAGAYWAAWGAGFPFGAGDPRAEQVGSLFAAAEPGPVGAAMAVLGLLGAVVAVGMARATPARGPLVFAWAMSGALLVAVPDIRVIQNFAYLFMGYTGLWDGPLLFMVFCIAGGALWAAAAWVHQGGGTREPVRWGRPVTYAAALLALPYAISRISWAAGIPLGIPAEDIAAGNADGGWISETVLGGLCVAGAVLTIGLVRRWGEVFPRWIPFLRGRRVPVWFAVVPGLAASVMLVQAGARLYLAMLTGDITITAERWGTFLPGLAWLPWGLALAAATYAYYLRRRA
ncbi:hypothetical protein [Nonomuraea sp. NPDC003754]